MGDSNCPFCREYEKVLKSLQKTIEFLQARVESFQLKVESYQNNVESLQQEVAELKCRLSQNSRNSSKPPSSDGLNKPKPQSLRKKSGRSPGGQDGHKGKALEMKKNPDRVIVHHTGQCEECGGSLRGIAATGVERRQVFDLPPISLEVVEHQAEQKECPACGCMNTAAFPDGVNAPVQYGPVVRSIAVYLQQHHFLPYERTGELMRDLFGVSISAGTLAKVMLGFSGEIGSAVERIRELVQSSPVAHFDESGVSVEGELQWLHSASTDTATYYDIHSRRGSEAMDDIGILPDFEGRAVHDFWSPYLEYKCDHGFCNAHLLRELVFAHEELGQKWAKKMISFLLKVKKTVGEAKAGCLSGKIVRRFERRYKRILKMGDAETPPPLNASCKKKRGRPKKDKARNLLERFERYPKEILAFMYDFHVPFDNNLSERDIRMIKLRQKISGTFRNAQWGKAFCQARSYISTARKNAVNVIEAIKSAFAGQPFVPSLSIGT